MLPTTLNIITKLLFLSIFAADCFLAYISLEKMLDNEFITFQKNISLPLTKKTAKTTKREKKRL